VAAELWRSGLSAARSLGRAGAVCTSRPPPSALSEAVGDRLHVHGELALSAVGAYVRLSRAN